MKKNLFIILMLISIKSFAQTEPTQKKALDCYLSGSLSVSTGTNFRQNSYPSVEMGVYVKNLAFAFNTGRLNFGKSPYKGEKLKNYYYELKTTASFPLGEIKGYVIAGWGQYYNSNHNFIEYGGGIIYSIKKIDLIIQVSNWDGTVYLSPGVVYNFSMK
jgi:hypothetical protein